MLHAKVDLSWLAAGLAVAMAAGSLTVGWRGLVALAARDYVAGFAELGAGLLLARVAARLVEAAMAWRLR